MIKIKSFILDETNWLEVTWDNENGEQVWCESFSGHREHIELLRAKALEFGTPLNTYESLIDKCLSKFVYPTQEELDKALVIQKIQEYKAYLLATDFKMTVDYYATLSEVEQLELTAKRQEAREYIRMNEVA